MDILRKLLGSLRNSGILLLVGVLLIIYAGFGVLYVQQGQQQKSFQKQITQFAPVLAKPLPPADALQKEYDIVKQALPPISDSDAIAMLVGIAEQNGIDVDESIGKFYVPVGRFGIAKIGTGTYKTLSFQGIRAQGDYEKVMAFLSDLDSGKTLNNMVLQRVTLNDVQAPATGEEGQRRAEFRNVADAVTRMMTDNNLNTIPNPVSYNGTHATNLMGDDPETEDTVEGFPDITTTRQEKGYTGSGLLRNGYVLYHHDKTATDNSSNYLTVDYITLTSTKYYTYTTNFTTQYYYTCEADGTVRQFNSTDINSATEYTEKGPSKIESIANLDIIIYFRP